MDLVLGEFILMELEYKATTLSDYIRLKWNQTGSMDIIPSTYYVYPHKVDEINSKSCFISHHL